MREHLTELIRSEVHDPRVTAVSVLGVSKVECTPDLSVAKVWISIYADDAVAEKAIKGLTAAAGFLRGPLGRRLNLVRPPELRFARDITAEMSIKLRAVVQEDEARARDVGRVAGEGPPEAASEAAREAVGPGPEELVTAPDPDPVSD
jgi:ribosome-binding factor A